MDMSSRLKFLLLKLIYIHMQSFLISCRFSLCDPYVCRLQLFHKDEMDMSSRLKCLFLKLIYIHMLSFWISCHYSHCDPYACRLYLFKKFGANMLILKVSQSTSNLTYLNPYPIFSDQLWLFLLCSICLQTLPIQKIWTGYEQ